LLERIDLADRAAVPAGQLSHGGQRRLEVGIMLALDPEVMMFDEPTAGMSADEAPVVLDLIQSIKEDSGKTILLVEHKMDVIRSLADRIIVLNHGNLIADGEPGEVMAMPIVREAYLGETIDEPEEVLS
jgi:branched-chain amino acid transport system ATP-binding protein